MTICNETGLACNCQPDEGVPCSALNGGLKKMMLDWRAEAIRLQSRLDAQQPAAAEPKHSDDLAVDRFAEAMKLKLAIKRAEGRGGWDDRNECSNERLAQMLINHVPKGDPVDIANFAMMIHQRDAQGIENGTIDNLPNGVKVIAFVAAGETADQQPAAASAGASDWLPIETAPKDGTYVLASNPASSGAWIAAYQPVAVSGYRFDDPWRSCMLNHYHLDAAGRYLTPTHWKPLPTPPGTPVATAQQSEAASRINCNDTPQLVYGTDTLAADPARLTAAARIDFSAIKSAPFPSRVQQSEAGAEEAVRADIVRNLEAMRETFHGSSGHHYVLGRAIAWINGERYRTEPPAHPAAGEATEGGES